MNSLEFDGCIGELRSFYGENAYAPKFVGLIFQIFRPLTVSECRQVIENLVGQFIKPPTPAQIKQVSYPLLQKAWERERMIEIEKLAGHQACAVCDHSGIFFALLRSNPTLEYSFGCAQCEAYRVRRLRHPRVWCDDLREKFAPVSLRSESYRAAMVARDAAYSKDRPASTKRHNIGLTAFLPAMVRKRMEES